MKIFHRHGLARLLWVWPTAIVLLGATMACDADDSLPFRGSRFQDSTPTAAQTSSRNLVVPEPVAQETEPLRASRLQDSTPTAAQASFRNLVVPEPVAQETVPPTSASGIGLCTAVTPVSGGPLPPSVQLSQLNSPQPVSGTELRGETIATPDPIEGSLMPSEFSTEAPCDVDPCFGGARQSCFHSRPGGSGGCNNACGDRGIGYERVAMAPFIIDIAQPMNQFAFRLDAAYGWRRPDLAEWLFARPSSLGGQGPPAIERSVNYQDFDFLTELGTRAMSVRTLIPVRLVDPEINENTGGLGDIQLETKVLLLDGQRWKISQVNGFYFNTGDAQKGLGTGHISMEPGVLASFEWNPATILHSEAKFLFPLGGGNPDQVGDVLTWGFGVSHILYDSDGFAVIPTLETVFYSILHSGGYTDYDDQSFHHFTGDTVPTIHAGLRFAWDRTRDFPLVEFGISGGVGLGMNAGYSSLFRAELRVVY
jgi:hypothetical protein